MLMQSVWDLLLEYKNVLPLNLLLGVWDGREICEKAMLNNVFSQKLFLFHYVKVLYRTAKDSGKHFK